MRHGSGLEELFDHPHITEHIVPLASLVAVGDQEEEEETKETDTDVDEVVPEGTGEAGDTAKWVRVDRVPGEEVLEEDREEGEGSLD